MNGAQRKLVLVMAAAFVTILGIILVANAESTLSDLHANGVTIRSDLVWSWEWTSMISWLSVYPLLWIAVARVRPPRFAWPVIAAALVLGSIAASGWHIGVMVLLRHLYYDAVGQGPYRFFGAIADRLLYEYRKDLGTYLQFVTFALFAQWLLARAGDPARAEAPPPMLEVADGNRTLHVPVAEIESVASAGNYVEIRWDARTLLHRTTLAATEEELGPAFVRIHRTRLVRRTAIRSVETDRSGDFTVTLASGATLKGSRRYRDQL